MPFDKKQGLMFSNRNNTKGKSSPFNPPPRPKVPPGFGGPLRVPNENDVLSGRGGRINSHYGNVRYRDLVQLMKFEYLSPRTRKLQKKHIAASIVWTIRTSSPPGRFLKEDPSTGFWVEIGDHAAFRKVGQALRENSAEVRSCWLNPEKEAANREPQSVLDALPPVSDKLDPNQLDSVPAENSRFMDNLKYNSQDNLKFNSRENLKFNSHDDLKFNPQDDLKFNPQDNLKFNPQDDLKFNSQDNLKFNSRNDLKFTSRDNLKFTSRDNLKFTSRDNFSFTPHDNLKFNSRDNLRLTSLDNFKFTSSNNFNLMQPENYPPESPNLFQNQSNSFPTRPFQSNLSIISRDMRELNSNEHQRPRKTGDNVPHFIPYMGPLSLLGEVATKF